MALEDVNRTMTRRGAIRSMGWMGVFGGLAIGTTGFGAPFFRAKAQATAFALVGGARAPQPIRHRVWTRGHRRCSILAFSLRVVLSHSSQRPEEAPWDSTIATCAAPSSRP